MIGTLLFRVSPNSSLTMIALKSSPRPNHSRKGVRRIVATLSVLISLASGTALAVTCPPNVGATATPTSDFSINVDGTVTHLPTGLMWKQCSEGLSGTSCGGFPTRTSWTNALNLAKASTFASYTDWRLPNKQELESLIDASCASPSINDIVFPNTNVAAVWSSTTVLALPAQAWAVEFNYGNSQPSGKAFSNVVRLVRGGATVDGLANLPTAPLAVTAAAGNGQLTLNFMPPTSDGGEAITDYSVGCGLQTIDAFVPSPAISLMTVSGSPTTINGLVNGLLYRCSVSANNASGTGPSVTVLSTPDDAALARQPGLSAVAGIGQVSLFITPPANNGGSPVTGYQVGCRPYSPLTTPVTNFTSSLNPVIAGLVNDRAYFCSAAAVNSAGTGPSVARVVTPVDPATRPGAPVIKTITAGDRSVSVTFDPPNYGGTSAIAQYQLLCNSTLNGFGYYAMGSPVSGATLTNGVTYGCSLNARNASGYTLRPTGAPADFTVTPNATGAAASGVTGVALATSTGTGNVVLAVLSCATCTLAQTQSVALVGAALSPSVPPPNGVIFPHGLVDYQIAGVPNGSAITLNVTYPQPLPDGTAYWKFGPAPGNTTPHWYTVPTTVVGNALTFSVTDGGPGDDDMTANGSISDPGGAGMIAACSLNVMGALSGPDAAIDGLLLLRYMLGLRGSALVQGVTLTAARPDALTVETFLANPGRFDVLGRTPPAPVATIDGVILLRLLQGVPDVSLLGGLTLPAAAQFNSASDIRGHVNLACGTSFPG